MYSNCLSSLWSVISKYYNSNRNINKIIQNIYFVTKTGQFEYVTTPEAVLPNNSFLNPDLPLVPITIKLILSCWAYWIISPYTANPVNITSSQYV